MQDDAVAIKDILLRSAERRMMALGSFYADMQLSDEEHQAAVRDVQLARMWEQQQVRQAVRRAELQAQRMSIVRRAEEPGAASIAGTLHALAQHVRSRALAVLQAEGNAADIELQQQLDAYVYTTTTSNNNNRHNNSISTSKRSSLDMGKREDVSMGGVLPPVVLNINVGGGRVEGLVLSEGDDVVGIAAAFVRRHGLPQSAIHTLVGEAQAALREGTDVRE